MKNIEERIKTKNQKGSGRMNQEVQIQSLYHLITATWLK